MRIKHRHRHARGRTSGVTLLELLVVMAIAAVLLGVAVPGFQQTFAETRAATRASDLVGALAMTRGEAIRRNVRVTLCKTSDPAATPLACEAAATWNEAWLLFVDNVHVPGNVAGVIDGADQVLRVFHPQGKGALSGGANYALGISYLGNGASRGIKAGGVAGLPNGTFTHCVDGKERKIIVSASGRVRVAKGACA